VSHADELGREEPQRQRVALFHGAEYISCRRQVERREPCSTGGRLTLGKRRSVAEQEIRRNAIMNDVNGTWMLTFLMLVIPRLAVGR
jgi:hypothetical protein